MTYSKEELKELQKVNLEMAKHFVSFCKQNKLLCYFTGGGCIGTVRNQGFIPWDDDLDFFMPRDDYNKLFELWKNTALNDRYAISKVNKLCFDGNQFITIRDTSTTMIKPYQKDLDIVQGVNLDIFPLDGCPDNKFLFMIQTLFAKINALYWTGHIPVNHGKIVKWAGTLLLAIIPSFKMRYNIGAFAEKQMSKYPFSKCKYVRDLCAGPAYMYKKYPRRAFNEAIWLPFEDTEMPVPKGYDEFLKVAFGDYMQLPPEEKRVSHHDCIFLDTHNSYKEYKGIYYCK